MRTIQKILQLSICCSLLYFCTSCKEDEDGDVNQPPKIENQTFSVQENSAKDTVVGTVKATDPNNDALTFSITSGNTGDAFVIAAASGEIKVNTASAFDFETNPSFTLVIQVSDGTVTATANITINLTDQNENTAPLIENQSLDIDENSENATAVGTVTATDADQDALTFSITDGNTNEAFAIDASSGALTVKTSSALNYEETPSFDLTVSVSDGTVSSTATITVTLNDVSPEPLTTKAEILESLTTSYADFRAYVEFTFIFDGVYANTTASPASGWDDIHAHSQNSLDAKVSQLWSDAFDIIFSLNNVIISAENVLNADPDKDGITAQAIALRAYLNFHLVTWFGSIPQETGIEDSQAAQVSQPNMITLIQSNLATAISNLPTSWPAGSATNVTKAFAKAALARTYIFGQDITNSLSESGGLISDPGYTLGASSTSFSSDNTEIIWGFDQTGNAEFTGFFSKGNYVPVFRLTEEYLIRAEANVFAGNLGDGKDDINELKQRASQTLLLDGLSQNDLLDASFFQWNSEMEEEGISFIILKRFGKAESTLSISNTQLILPIPQSVIDVNPNLFQNPGY